MSHTPEYHHDISCLAVKMCQTQKTWTIMNQTKFHPILSDGRWTQPSPALQSCLQWTGPPEHPWVGPKSGGPNETKNLKKNVNVVNPGCHKPPILINFGEFMPPGDIEDGLLLALALGLPSSYYCCGILNCWHRLLRKSWPGTMVFSSALVMALVTWNSFQLKHT